MQEIKDLSQMVGLIYKIEKHTNEKKKDTQLLIASWKPITAHRKDFLTENKKKSSKKSDISKITLILFETYFS